MAPAVAALHFYASSSSSSSSSSSFLARDLLPLLSRLIVQLHRIPLSITWSGSSQASRSAHPSVARLVAADSRQAQLDEPTPVSALASAYYGGGFGGFGAVPQQQQQQNAASSSVAGWKALSTHYDASEEEEPEESKGQANNNQDDGITAARHVGRERCQWLLNATSSLASASVRLALDSHFENLSSRAVSLMFVVELLRQVLPSDFADAEARAIALHPLSTDLLRTLLRSVHASKLRSLPHADLSHAEFLDALQQLIRLASLMASLPSQQQLDIHGVVITRDEYLVRALAMSLCSDAVRMALKSPSSSTSTSAVTAENQHLIERALLIESSLLEGLKHSMSQVLLLQSPQPDGGNVNVKPASKKEEEAKQPSEWSCPACTYINPIVSLRCDICTTDNPSPPKTSPATTAKLSAAANQNELAAFETHFQSLRQLPSASLKRLVSLECAAFNLLRIIAARSALNAADGSVEPKEVKEAKEVKTSHAASASASEETKVLSVPSPSPVSPPSSSSSQIETVGAELLRVFEQEALRILGFERLKVPADRQHSSLPHSHCVVDVDRLEVHDPSSSSFVSSHPAMDSDFSLSFWVKPSQRFVNRPLMLASRWSEPGKNQYKQQLGYPLQQQPYYPQVQADDLGDEEYLDDEDNGEDYDEDYDDGSMPPPVAPISHMGFAPYPQQYGNNLSYVYRGPDFRSPHSASVFLVSAPSGPGGMVQLRLSVSNNRSLPEIINCPAPVKPNCWQHIGVCLRGLSVLIFLDGRCVLVKTVAGVPLALPAKPVTTLHPNPQQVELKVASWFALGDDKVLKLANSSSFPFALADSYASQLFAAIKQSLVSPALRQVACSSFFADSPSASSALLPLLYRVLRRSACSPALLKSSLSLLTRLCQVVGPEQVNAALSYSKQEAKEEDLLEHCLSAIALGLRDSSRREGEGGSTHSPYVHFLRSLLAMPEAGLIQQAWHRHLSELFHKAIDNFPLLLANMHSSRSDCKDLAVSDPVVGHTLAAIYVVAGHLVDDKAFLSSSTDGAATWVAGGCSTFELICRRLPSLLSHVGALQVVDQGGLLLNDDAAAVSVPKKEQSSQETAAQSQLDAALANLMSMGFNKRDSQQAIMQSGGDVNAATSLILEGSVPPAQPHEESDLLWTAFVDSQVQLAARKMPKKAPAKAPGAPKPVERNFMADLTSMVSEAAAFVKKYDLVAISAESVADETPVQQEMASLSFTLKRLQVVSGIAMDKSGESKVQAASKQDENKGVPVAPSLDMDSYYKKKSGGGWAKGTGYGSGQGGARQSAQVAQEAAKKKQQQLQATGALLSELNHSIQRAQALMTDETGVQLASLLSSSCLLPLLRNYLSNDSLMELERQWAIYAPILELVSCLSKSEATAAILWSGASASASPASPSNPSISRASEAPADSVWSLLSQLAKQASVSAKLMGHKGSKTSKSSGEVHYGITCDGCRANPIRGNRWNCAVCPDYDHCDDCISQEHLHYGHSFVKIETSQYQNPHARAQTRRQRALETEDGSDKEKDHEIFSSLVRSSQQVNSVLKPLFKRKQEQAQAQEQERARAEQEASASQNQDKDKAVVSSSSESKESKEAKSSAQQFVEQYVGLLSSRKFRDVPDFKQHHYWKKKATHPGALSRQCMRRLQTEFADLSKSLPLHPDSSVFMRVKESDMSLAQVLIFGPTDTPYARGAFLFDVQFPANYPSVPPHVNLQTTGAGSVRFNPNLYNCGKVCLSLLGTWSGSAEEKWNAASSTFLQVCVSIQSLIMVPQPYFNEPGYEGDMGSSRGDQLSNDYNAVIRLGTARFAILDPVTRLVAAQSKKTKTKADEVMAGLDYELAVHFFLQKEAIEKQLDEWCQDGSMKGSQLPELQGLTQQIKDELAKLLLPEPPADDDDDEDDE